MFLALISVREGDILAWTLKEQQESASFSFSSLAVVSCSGILLCMAVSNSMDIQAHPFSLVKAVVSVQGLYPELRLVCALLVGITNFVLLLKG